MKNELDSHQEPASVARMEPALVEANRLWVQRVQWILRTVLAGGVDLISEGRQLSSCHPMKLRRI